MNINKASSGILSFLLSFIIFNSYSQEIPAFIPDSLDLYMSRAIVQWQVPGAAVAVVENGKVIYMKGFGTLEAGGSEKVDENTLFMIGSNTKAFTATSLAILEEEGKCSLEDKVRQWLPDFMMMDPWVANEINLTDILCHRIGMETYQGDFMYWTSDLSLKEVIEKFGKLSPKYGFRSRWGYTNACFAIAGACIEKISGMPWESCIRSAILDPLGMTRTLTLSTQIAGAANAAKSHTLVNGKLVEIPYPKIDNLAPAGSISSSVSDMSHWMICLLDSGRYQGRQVIPWEAIERTRQPESIEGGSSTFFKSTHFQLYGLGWELSDYAGFGIVSHTGGVNGFATSVTLVPERKIGIAIFTNSDMDDLYASAKRDILDAMLGQPYHDFNSIFLNAFNRNYAKDVQWVRSKRDSVSLHLRTSFPFEAYAGTYSNDAYGTINIKAEKGKLVMTFQHHPDLKGEMESLGSNRFLCTYSDPEFGIKVIPFRAEDGKIISFDLHVADFIEETSYNFNKNQD